MISCIIPLYDKDKDYLWNCFNSLKLSAEQCEEKVEFLLIHNNIGAANAKNIGGFSATGEFLVFVDADCSVSPEFFSEISEKGKDDRWVGGGMRYVIPTNPTFGVRCFILFWTFYCTIKQISIGAFCIRQDPFISLAGFDKSSKYHDVDLALRLRKYAKRHGKFFQPLTQSKLIWSTRKFEKYGSWHWLRGYHTGW
jgi:GT2 family glycosyltransferase